MPPAVAGLAAIVLLGFDVRREHLQSAIQKFMYHEASSDGGFDQDAMVDSFDQDG